MSDFLREKNQTLNPGSAENQKHETLSPNHLQKYGYFSF